MPKGRKTPTPSSRKRKTSSTSKKKPEPKKKKDDVPATTASNFPTRSIHQLMEQKLPGGMVKPEAALYLTAVMEYLAAEIIEQSMNAASSRMNSADVWTVRLTRNDVATAIENDPELKELLDKARRRSTSNNQ